MTDHPALGPFMIILLGIKAHSFSRILCKIWWIVVWNCVLSTPCSFVLSHFAFHTLILLSKVCKFYINQKHHQTRENKIPCVGHLVWSLKAFLCFWETICHRLPCSQTYVWHMHQACGLSQAPKALSDNTHVYLDIPMRPSASYSPGFHKHFTSLQSDI